MLYLDKCFSQLKDALYSTALRKVGDLNEKDSKLLFLEIKSVVSYLDVCFERLEVIFVGKDDSKDGF